MRHAATFMAWLLGALTGVALLLVGLRQGGSISNLVVLLAAPLAASTTLILIPWSAYRAIFAIAVAMLVLGAVMVSVPFYLPASRAIFHDDSLGIGRLMLLAVGVVLLAWGTFTALAASSARSELRKGNAVGRGLAIMTAVPSVIVVALAALMVI